MEKGKLKYVVTGIYKEGEVELYKRELISCMRYNKYKITMYEKVKIEDGYMMHILFETASDDMESIREDFNNVRELIKNPIRQPAMRIMFEGERGWERKWSNINI